MSNNSSIKKSIFIVGLEKFSMIFFQFISSIIMARILSPSDYGTVAMLAIFISLSGTLVDSGFGGSLIYYNDVTKKDFSTVFWINISMSIGLYLLLLLFSDQIASFYETPILSPLTKVLALTIVFNSLGQVQYSMLYKNLQFKRISIINISTYVISALVAIFLAYLGFGVWALITQQVLSSLLRTVILMFINRFIPSLYFSNQLLRKHWNYGSGLFFSNVLKIVYDNIYVQLIGKFTSIDNSGYYNQAKRLKDIPAELFSRTFTTTLFPIFSRIRDDNEFVLRFRLINRLFAFCFCPFFFLISLLSTNIVLFLLGDKWLASAWIFQIISIGAIFYILETVNRNALKAKGKSMLIFRLDLIKRVISLVIIIIGIFKFEILGICIAYVVNSVFGWLINAYALSKFSRYRFVKQIFDILKYICYSLIASLFIVFIKKIGLTSDILCILIYSILFFISYCMIAIFTKDNSYTYCKDFILSKLFHIGK